MSFSGLCIGGPAAGKRVTCQAEFYRTVLPQPIPPSWQDLPPQRERELVQSRVFTYKWVVGIDLGRENLTNFWVPEDRDALQGSGDER